MCRILPLQLFSFELKYSFLLHRFKTILITCFRSNNFYNNDVYLFRKDYCGILRETLKFSKFCFEIK